MDEKIFVPPIKIQGIKTKLVPLIKSNIIIDKDTVWIEPFMGSGVVGFNIQPHKAIFADINPHIINFYNDIKNKAIDAVMVKAFLQEEGAKLSKWNDEYFYEVRKRFNETHSSLDFLFLNRSCFNGMIRFNKDHKFNVPYGHKPERFSRAYVTKITNQVKHIEDMLYYSDWIFICQSFEKTISNISEDNAFIYCDPPYIGRHVDYYDSWDISSENKLNVLLTTCNHPFMVSTWDHNQYRKNEHLETIWHKCQKINKEHFYFVGANEANRNTMIEALLVNYSPMDKKDYCPMIGEQLHFYAN